MMLGFSNIAALLLPAPVLVSASPQAQVTLSGGNGRFFDVQAHRGGRGNTIENTLPAFAQALIEGATTLELDNGVTRDGVVVVWHDENITSKKCRDTSPATENDPDFPYVGKYISNLTIAQIKTLDCGSQRQSAFPLQLINPGTRISTLEETFNFVACADPEYRILWNIEAKVNPLHPEHTVDVNSFVRLQHEVFQASSYAQSITFQSFDWGALAAMKALNPNIIASALVEDFTIAALPNGTYPWLAGVDLDSFEGSTLGVRIVKAARSISADILSPSVDPFEAPGPLFTTKMMVDEAHRLGLKVKPWTVNDLDIVDQLLNWNVDGIITDYPSTVRRWAKQQGLPVAPKYPKQRVFECLERHSASWR